LTSIRKTATAALLVLAVILGAACGAWAADLSPGLPPNLFDDAGIDLPRERVEAPAFGEAPLVDTGGAEARLSDFRGQVVLVNFWATWCAPCREEMPSMERLYRRLGDRGLVVVAVSVDRGRAEKRVRQFAEKYGISFPVLLDANGEAADTYRVAALPTSYIIGRDGFLLGRAIGGREWDSPEVVRLFESILEKE